MAIRLKLNKGDRFGKLTVISEGKKIILPSGQPNRTIKCKCDCGNVKEIRLLHLKRGRIISCGCFKNVLNGESNTDIGRLYRSIRWRCDKRNPDRKTYYDRGITICDEWLNNYLKFKEWVSNSNYKKGLQIDRVNNNKGYYPGNCRFVTSQTNNNNRRDTLIVQYNGNKKPLREILRSINKMHHYYSIRSRMIRGWEPQTAIDTPIRKGNYKLKNTIKNY